jgi:hypothetical protein
VPSLRVYCPLPWRHPSFHSPGEGQSVREGQGQAGRLTDVDVAVGEVIGAVALHLALDPLAREDDLSVSSHPHAVAALSAAHLSVEVREGQEKEEAEAPKSLHRESRRGTDRCPFHFSYQRSN